jgi:hypothetical protein
MRGCGTSVGSYEVANDEQHLCGLIDGRIYGRIQVWPQNDRIFN